MEEFSKEMQRQIDKQNFRNWISFLGSRKGVAYRRKRKAQRMKRGKR